MTFIGLTFIAVLGVSAIGMAQEDTWAKKADMHTARFAPSTSVVNEKIYVIGGGDNADNPLSTVEAYDPATDTWTQKADMPTLRGWAATNAPAVNGKIYVIGGWKTFIGAGLSTVEEYDPMTDTWTQKADMPTPRGGALAISEVGGKIYVMGGSSLTQVYDTVEVYDPTTDTWTRKADMPTARTNFSASAVNGKIYAIGGWSRIWLSTVEAYDTGVGIRVKTISPQQGGVSGGEAITISGSSFPPDAVVTIDGNLLTDLKVTDSLITGFTPPGIVPEQELLITTLSHPISDFFFRDMFFYVEPTAVVVTRMTPSNGAQAGAIPAASPAAAFNRAQPCGLGTEQRQM